jgi:hypothetical protein
MRPLLLASALVAAAALACSSSSPSAGPGDGGGAAQGAGDDAGCPADLPPSCPTPAPSWANDAQPIFADKCWPCHADGGVESAADPLGTYAQIAANSATVLVQIETCRMPQAGAPPLTREQRHTLEAWLVCGARDD